MNTPSLKTKLRSANSEQAIVDLISEGQTYKFASDGTRRQWKKAARIQLAAVKGVKYEEEVPVIVVREEEFVPNTEKKKDRWKQKKQVAA
jgi:hypothetical protein